MKGEANDKAAVDHCGNGRARGLRDDSADAGDADMPRRSADPGEPALSAAASTPAASAAAADGLSGRNRGPGGHHLPDTAASASGAAASGPGRREGLSQIGTAGAEFPAGLLSFGS
jgi:hypothetical protein